jgi:glycolate oxidase FAD binding subunit
MPAPARRANPMKTLAPDTPAQLAAILAEASAAERPIRIEGGNSKRRMGGAWDSAAEAVSTRALNRILKYEPNDLTVSVEAGMLWRDFQAELASNNQTVPLDPPFFETATVGGVLAAGTCGPRRRWYGAPRDVVIGMKLAMLDGKLLQSGGMVVKNVAGLDMGKLIIGSFGTLAAIAVANFKVTPIPPASRTFLFCFPSLETAVAARDRILAGVLQPVALDLLNPHASARVGLENWSLAVQAAGSERVIARYTREFEAASPLDGAGEAAFWKRIREFTPDFLAAHGDGAVVRYSATLGSVAAILRDVPVPALCRAGNGIVYAYFPDVEAAVLWAPRHGGGVIESLAPRSCSPEEQWPNPGGDLAVMRRIKELFDPKHLLNRGRLYGRI